MLTNPALGRPYDFAVSCLAQAGGDLDQLPVPLQTLLIVESAQGIIDSGGLEYFYEADFPNNPPYASFVEAYRRIGAEEAASCIEASSLMFPFDEPHLFAPLREVWLEKFRMGHEPAFARLSQRICGDESVWTLLADYVEAHRGAFSPR
jgi:hypothetical protein